MSVPRLSDVEVADSDGQTTVAVRLEGKMADLDIPALFDEFLPVVIEHVRNGGLEAAGPTYLRSFAFGPDDYDLEIGVPTAEAYDLPDLESVERGKPGSSSLPSGRMAKVTHFGPYNTLSAAYRRLSEWMGANDLEPGIGAWESYIDDPAEVEEISELRTDILWPLA